MNMVPTQKTPTDINPIKTINLNIKRLVDEVNNYRKTSTDSISTVEQTIAIIVAKAVAFDIITDYKIREDWRESGTNKLIRAVVNNINEKVGCDIDLTLTHVEKLLDMFFKIINIATEPSYSYALMNTLDSLTEQTPESCPALWNVLVSPHKGD